MWAFATLVLIIVLVVVIAVNQRREQKILARLRRTLRTAGDDRMKPNTVDAGFDRLDSLLHADETDLLPRRAASALNELNTGVVLADADGQVVLRNRLAEPYANARHGDALVENAIQGRVHDALRGEHTDEELRLHGPPERFLLVMGGPLVEKGELIGAVVLVDDISEQQRLDAVRRDFVANVSHELRTPVGALGLLAETIEGEEDPHVVADFLSRIQHETVRLANLIDDLLDLSRIEAQGSEEKDEFSLGSVLEEGVAAVRAAADHKRVTVDLDVESDPVLHGDRAQMLSAASNLLENAVKYTDAGGAVRGSVVTNGTEVAMVVTDSGIGIPQRELARVFERFYRVDRGRSAATTGGTGLGLSIVRHVVLNHGGRVEVESEEGVGSTFSMILPLDIPSHSESDRVPESDVE